MQNESLVSEYFNAWCEGDCDRLRYILDDDCVLLDAYFGDVVPAREIPRYLRQDFAASNVQYSISRVSECNSATARYVYNAKITDRDGNEISGYTGAEKLKFRRGRICRITDCYDAPPELLSIYYENQPCAVDEFNQPTALSWSIAEIIRCRSDLYHGLRAQRLYVFPGLSASTMACRIGHAADLIEAVVYFECGGHFRAFLDIFRVNRAAELIEQRQQLDSSPLTRVELERIATKVGFISYARFRSSFKGVIGELPARYNPKKRSRLKKIPKSVETAYSQVSAEKMHMGRMAENKPGADTPADGPVIGDASRSH